MDMSPNQYTEPTVRRIDGIKYHVALLTIDELEGIRGHLTTRHCQIVGDIALVDEIIGSRVQDVPMEHGHEA